MDTDRIEAAAAILWCHAQYKGDDYTVRKIAADMIAAADKGSSAEIARLTAIAAPDCDLIDQYRAEIARLTAERDRMLAALQRIDGINDNPAKYNPDIEAVLRGALEQTAQTEKT